MSSVTHPRPGAQVPAPPPASPPDEGADAREQLVNGGAVGPVGRVSIPEAMITRLNGIMLDFDPELYRPERLAPGATTTTASLYELFVGPMLQRHPLYAKAEVRDTGRGLHAVLRFDPPVVFGTPAEREKWAAVVRVVQRALPTDPACPGLTATTRPVGSTNGKTGRAVRVLKEGAPVTPDEVLRFVADVGARPFKVVAGFLLDPAAPSCPVCAKPDARMGVTDTFGTCYGGKHRPRVADLFASVFAPRAAAGEV